MFGVREACPWRSGSTSFAKTNPYPTRLTLFPRTYKQLRHRVRRLILHQALVVVICLLKMSLSAVKFVLVMLCVSAVIAADEYLADSQKECNTKSDLFSCGKYEAARFLVRAASSGPVRTKIVDGVVDFVTLDKPEVTEGLFPAARQISNESEFRKFVKFVQRQVDAYLGSRALSITLPSQTRLVDADEPNNEIGKRFPTAEIKYSSQKTHSFYNKNKLLQTNTTS